MEYNQLSTANAFGHNIDNFLLLLDVTKTDFHNKAKY